MCVRHNNFWRVTSVVAGLVPLRGAGPGALGTVNTAPCWSIPRMWAVILHMTSGANLGGEVIARASDKCVISNVYATHRGPHCQCIQIDM